MENKEIWPIKGELVISPQSPPRTPCAHILRSYEIIVGLMALSLSSTHQDGCCGNSRLNFNGSIRGNRVKY